MKVEPSKITIKGKPTFEIKRLWNIFFKDSLRLEQYFMIRA